MVALYESGKTRKSLIEQYDLTPSALDKWIRQSRTTGSFQEKDNLTMEQKELYALRKRNTELGARQIHNPIFHSFLCPFI